MAKVTKRGDELQSKKSELLEDITSTVREIYKIKGPIKDVRTVIDVLDEKVMVYCGDFNGNLEGFREWAKKTFDGKNQKEYLTIADFMEQHFAPEKEED